MPGPGARRCLIPLTLVVAAPGLASCDADRAPRRVAARVATSARAAAVPGVAEVRQAYLDYWSSYARMMRTLDPQGVDCCSAGPHLATMYRYLDERVRARRGERVRATHRIAVHFVTPERAVVRDDLVDDTVEVDADTGRALGPAPHRVAREQYVLEHRDGTWKVVFATGS
jgi:hypothetical protein